MNPLILEEPAYRTWKRDHSIAHERDVVAQQMNELTEIGAPPPAQTYWVVFPWIATAVRTVGKDTYRALRTNRNRNLITPEEQQKLFSACIGCFGLSVGGSIVSTLAQQGVGGIFKLTDFDTLATTNLNRLRTGMTQIGMPKIDILAQELYELDPFYELHLYPRKVSDTELEDFFTRDPKPDVVFEEIDSFDGKFEVRKRARKARIPVVMLTNLGDRVLVDVERFDAEPDRPPFHGLVPLGTDNAVDFVGKENLSERLRESVRSVGTTLVGRPQLASTVAISGGVGTYVAREIILGRPMPSGRYRIDLDDFQRYAQSL